MITEDYVSFAIAKLLKEKGFDCSSYSHYRLDNGELCRFNTNCSTNIKSNDYITAPTIQMAMKWLRKKHNLAISTSVTVDGWRSCVSQIKLDSEGFVVDIIDGIDDGHIPNSDTYEKACEAAIKYCLEKLI